MVEKVERPVWRILINVLKDDMVESKFVFCVERFEPVIVEKVERPVWRANRFDAETVESVE
jgi:hypothetical protein